MRDYTASELVEIFLGALAEALSDPPPAPRTADRHRHAQFVRLGVLALRLLAAQEGRVALALEPVGALAVDRGALQRLGRLGSRLQRGLIPAQPRELGVSILLALGLVLGRHARRVRRVRRCSSRLGGALLISR